VSLPRSAFARLAAGGSHCGERCALSKQKIADALGPLAGKVKISKARAAYDKFEMVEDQDAPIKESADQLRAQINARVLLAVVGVGALIAGSCAAVNTIKRFGGQTK
jgi:hypothetical protein